MLADFPNIARWNSGVKHSESTSESSGGVGATRHCDLAPVGALEETVAEWEPDQRMVVRIDSAAKLPIRSGEVTFLLEERAGATDTLIRYTYEPKGGRLLAPLMGPVIDRQLRSGFEGFLADLDEAAG